VQSRKLIEYGLHLGVGFGGNGIGIHWGGRHPHLIAGRARGRDQEHQWGIAK
jgi:hypothetical protein